MTAQQLKTARSALKMTGEELAFVLQVNARTLRRWESGGVPVPGPVDLAVTLLLAQSVRK